MCICAEIFLYKIGTFVAFSVYLCQNNEHIKHHFLLDNVYQSLWNPLKIFSLGIFILSWIILFRDVKIKSISSMCIFMQIHPYVHVVWICNFEYIGIYVDILVRFLYYLHPCNTSSLTDKSQRHSCITITRLLFFNCKVSKWKKFLTIQIFQDISMFYFWIYVFWVAE